MDVTESRQIGGHVLPALGEWFAIDDPAEFGDHYRPAFDLDDDTGTDGRVHAELAGVHARATGRYPDTVPLPRHVCACGFATDDTPEFDDHLLTAFITPDGIGTDGNEHLPLNPSTPDPLEYSTWLRQLAALRRSGRTRV